jgi:hypothetical protein
MWISHLILVAYLSAIVFFSTLAGRTTPPGGLGFTDHALLLGLPVVSLVAATFRAPGPVLTLFADGRLGMRMHDAGAVHRVIGAWVITLLLITGL